MEQATPASGEVEPNERGPGAACRTLDILVVDDTERNLDALEAMLGGVDARVVKARSGSEALRRLIRQDFALVLLDVRMPDMDGFETARLVRERERSRDTPIVFLTAYERSREDEVRGYGLGAVDFLAKPIVPEVLRAKVAVLLELRRKTEEVRRQAALLRAAEAREHERRLGEARRAWEDEALRREVERERQVSDAVHRSNARLRLLTEVARELLLREDLGSFPGWLFPLVKGHLAVDACLHHRREASDGALVLEAHAGLESERVGAVERVPPSDQLFGRAAASQGLVVVEDTGPPDAPAFPFLRAAALGACAAYPLRAGSQLHGTLAFGTARRSGFEPEELAAMGLVSDQIAAALERARLVHELRHSAGELERSAAELREADARKDQFLAMLGHELRNPLAPVLNGVKLMRRCAPPQPGLERVLAAADRQIAVMRRLLDDLLDVSRIRSGKVELRREPVDLQRVVADAVETTVSILEERRHALEVRLPEAPLLVMGDPVRLAQVMANLLHNAAKYTDSGGHVEVRGERQGDEAVLIVKDDGTGIAPDVLPHVFGLFVQGEQSADRARGGLGLGLTLVKNLVELHGGKVSARSGGPGQGSEFEVRLPALREEEAAVAAVREVSPPRTHQATAREARPLDVVIVEDNRDVRESLKELLELRGCKVQEAKDGKSGLELIRARSPQIAIVDIGLPGIDGYELAREVRATPTPTRLVAMTGYANREERDRALHAGFDAHMAKPVDFDDLSRLIDKLS
jgi:signal transduction histidine kinase/DNA-binding response OmpR family regulator